MVIDKVSARTMVGVGGYCPIRAVPNLKNMRGARLSCSVETKTIVHPSREKSTRGIHLPRLSGRMGSLDTA